MEEKNVSIAILHLKEVGKDEKSRTIVDFIYPSNNSDLGFEKGTVWINGHGFARTFDKKNYLQPLYVGNFEYVDTFENNAIKRLSMLCTQEGEVIYELKKNN